MIITQASFATPENDPAPDGRSDRCLYFQQGKVRDDAARKYPGYTYRVPVERPINIWTMDPGRWLPMAEYPRDIIRVNQEPYLRIVELADYVVRADEVENIGACDVQTWIMPNQYTAACRPVLVFEFQATIETVINQRDQIFEYALKQAFSPWGER